MRARPVSLFVLAFLATGLTVRGEAAPPWQVLAKVSFTLLSAL